MDISNEKDKIRMSLQIMTFQGILGGMERKIIAPCGIEFGDLYG